MVIVSILYLKNLEEIIRLLKMVKNVRGSRYWSDMIVLKDKVGNLRIIFNGYERIKNRIFSD